MKNKISGILVLFIGLFACAQSFSQLQPYQQSATAKYVQTSRDTVVCPYISGSKVTAVVTNESESGNLIVYLSKKDSTVLDSNSYVLVGPKKRLRFSFYGKRIYRNASSDSVYSQVIFGDDVELGSRRPPGVEEDLIPPVAYDADAQAYFTRSSVSDTAVWWKTGVNTFILALKGHSLYTDIAAMWIHASPDGTTALHNVISSSYTATLSGSPTFTVFEGYTGVGTTYIDYNFNLSTNGSPIYTQNDGGFSVYQRAAAPVDGVWVGYAYVSATYMRLLSGNIRFDVNSTADGVFTTALRQANWTTTRLSATHLQLYADGSLLSNYAANSTAPLSLNLYGLANNANGGENLHSNCQLSVVTIHGGWDATQVANYNASVEVFMDYLGKGVQ